MTSKQATMRRIFEPILAGATFRDRMLACAGGLTGIALTSFITSWILNDSAILPFIVAPMGASAVLVFAVPASPLAQPWPVIGGNAISAFAGVFCAHLFGSPHVAAGFAVGLAILAMSLTRSLHPPGGAAALTAVIGGETIEALGYSFVFLPIVFNAVCLVIVGVLYHRISGHNYPHQARSIGAQAIPQHEPTAPHSDDIEAALRDLGEAFDIGKDDLELIVRQVEFHAARRRRKTIHRSFLSSRKAR